jgi:hypothetical protein
MALQRLAMELELTREQRGHGRARNKLEQPGVAELVGIGACGAESLIQRLSTPIGERIQLTAAAVELAFGGQVGAAHEALRLLIKLACANDQKSPKPRVLPISARADRAASCCSPARSQST